jgi:Asp-tRNA(Asn)/Glu-tRNA(Gln) amidotransferase A subunit family amidase
MSLVSLGLAAAAEEIRSGRLSSLDYVEACLTRIEEFEPEIGAWSFLDPDFARAEAAARDEYRRRGHSTGPLHGLPIGVKDIVDVQGMPCEFGSPLYAGRRPRRDAHLVTKLRAAGAIIPGKTVTTEFATFTPGKTRNPHNPDHTPGGSSSGSAAAVAAFMLPGAIGSQTKASIVRPAAYCGLYGYKPSYGMISRSGVLKISPPLDQMGTLARSLEDAALLAEVIVGHDPEDPGSLPPFPTPPLVRTLLEDPPVLPRIAFLKGPFWDRVEPALQEACGELLEAVGERMSEIALPEGFEQALGWQETIMESETARLFAADLARDDESGSEGISASFRGLIEKGRSHSAVAFNEAMAARAGLNAILEEIFEEFDAIVTPSAAGEAPEGLDFTGNPVFGAIWTFLGLPCVSLPLFQGEKGLPMAVQAIGPAGDDARLLRTAHWLVRAVEKG